MCTCAVVAHLGIIVLLESWLSTATYRY